MKKFTPREEVLDTYPNAQAVNVGCKNGKYYNIIIDNHVLGKGKSAKNAWKSASNNIN